MQQEHALWQPQSAHAVPHNRFSFIAWAETQWLRSKNDRMFHVRQDYLEKEPQSPWGTVLHRILLEQSQGQYLGHYYTQLDNDCWGSRNVLGTLWYATFWYQELKSMPNSESTGGSINESRWRKVSVLISKRKLCLKWKLESLKWKCKRHSATDGFLRT